MHVYILTQRRAYFVRRRIHEFQNYLLSNVTNMIQDFLSTELYVHIQVSQSQSIRSYITMHELCIQQRSLKMNANKIIYTKKVGNDRRHRHSYTLVELWVEHMHALPRDVPSLLKQWSRPLISLESKREKWRSKTVPHFQKTLFQYFYSKTKVALH